MSEEELEQLLRETMAEFWKQNNLGQKYDVIRAALRKAAGLTHEAKGTIGA